MNQADRAARREEISCGAVPQPNPLKQPPVRLPQGCEAPAVVPDQVFFAPSATAPSDITQTPSPGGVLVESNQQGVACADVEGKGPVGSSVVVSHGTFSDYFYFQSIEGINESQLRYIDSLDEETLNSVMAAVDSALDAGEDEEGTAALLEAAAAIIAELVVLPVEKARLVVTELVSIKAALNELALQAGESALDCYWVNQAVSAECASGALETPGVEGAEVTNPSEVAAGVYRSASSQEDADAVAQLAATAALVCLWGNAETTKTCADLDPSFSESVPNDEAPVGVMERARVGTVVIPANTVFSTVSQSDANSQAETLALQGLVCFYTNTEVTRTCEDIGKTGTVESSGDYLTGQPGSEIIVPAGSILSLVSTSDANAQAATAAEQLLQCVWVNAEQTATCLSIMDPAPPEGEGPSIIKSPVYTYTVEAGTVTSDVSQADADDTAKALAAVQLDCLFCNKAISATCVPLEGGDISVDQTSAVAAGTFCASTFAEAQALAVSVASVPDASKSTPTTEAGYGCRYGNSEIKVKCFGVSGDDGSTPDYYGITGIKKFTVAALPASTLLTLNTSQDGHVVISKNTFVLALSEIPVGPDRSAPQAYVDTFARNLALAMLTCIFGNAEQTDSSPCPSGFTKLQDGVVAENSIQSLISQEDANTQASILAASLKICIDNDLLGSVNIGAGFSPEEPTCLSSLDEIKAAIQAVFAFPVPAPSSGTVVNFANGAVYELIVKPVDSALPDNPKFFFTITIQSTDYYATALELPCDEELYHPYKIVLRNAPGDSESSPYYGVVYKSSLYLSRAPEDKTPIDGLLGSENPDTGDSGWQGGVEAGDKVWLEITLNASGVVDSAEIQWSGEGSFDTSARAWSGGDSYCEDDGDAEEPRHKISRILIGSFENDPSSGRLKINQLIKNHLILKDVSIDGRSARYPEIFSGGL